MRRLNQGPPGERDVLSDLGACGLSPAPIHASLRHRWASHGTEILNRVDIDPQLLVDVALSGA